MAGLQPGHPLSASGVSVTTKLVIGGVLGFLGLAAAVGPAMAARKIAEPAYALVGKFEGFEVREYSKRVIAQTRVGGDAREASNTGFKILAGYIFGGNRSRTSISMTAPVGQERVSEMIDMTAPVGQRRDAREWIVTFTMPAAYTLATLPEPLDARIELRELPARRVAVWRFSGNPKPAIVEQRKRELIARVGAEGLVPVGEAEYARYDPPWVLPLLRRNELWVELGEPVAAAAD